MPQDSGSENEFAGDLARLAEISLDTMNVHHCDSTTPHHSTTMVARRKRPNTKRLSGLAEAVHGGQAPLRTSELLSTNNQQKKDTARVSALLALVHGAVDPFCLFTCRTADFSWLLRHSLLCYETRSVLRLHSIKHPSTSGCLPSLAWWQWAQ